MKDIINHGAKRALSIALALAMLCGTLLTANANATTTQTEAPTFPEGYIDVLKYEQVEGSTDKYMDTRLADNGETGADWDHAIIIDSALELVYLCKAANDETASKYYKVADGIAGFDLSGGAITDYADTLENQINNVTGAKKNHGLAKTEYAFQGHFDGNGATVYGAWIDGGSYAGLFPRVKGEVEIKNINVTLSYFKSGTGVGGIVGYHDAPSRATLKIEKCSVTKSHLELTGTGYCGVGAILGYGGSAPSYNDNATGSTVYPNCPYLIDNCYINLDAAHVVSCVDTTLTDLKTGDRPCHGGIAGILGSNEGKFTNCIVIGIKPYSVIDSTEKNHSQHTGMANHFENIYTTSDVAVTNVTVAPGGFVNSNGSTNNGVKDQDFSTRIIPLSDANLKGSNAVRNMNLDWSADWIPADEGEYPTPNQTGTTNTAVSFWSGSAATEFAAGTGTKNDPYIIATADQLYKALSETTDNTNNVAGGVQTSQILKQGSTTEYVPVFTPNYYKVADGVEAFYLNTAVYGAETLAGAKSIDEKSNKSIWKPGKSFVGHLDGNGVTIYGLYSSSGKGLIEKLDGTSTVKNINFDACYSISSGSLSALLTTQLGSYLNDSTTINVSNISVRNSYIGITGNINATQRADNQLYQMNGSVGGIIATNNTAEKLTISNCFFDGVSCDRGFSEGFQDEITPDELGGIISGGTNMNNVSLNGCISLGAPVVDEVYINSNYELFYSRYSTHAGYEVHFNECYTDTITELYEEIVDNGTYPGKYDRIKDIIRLDTATTYTQYDLPCLAWENWELKTFDGRTIPMPVVNGKDVANTSFEFALSSTAGAYASVGPFLNRLNPYAYKLEGSGTENDPYIITTAVELARAIATGGMNLYDRLYYRLGNDIDISDGRWITTNLDGNTSAQNYTYTPFGGSLDGNGHTVTGLSIGDTDSAGLIPVLANGGEVKNLHLRDSYVTSSTYAGAIVGKQEAGSTVTGCSVETSTVKSQNGGEYIIGQKQGTYDTGYYIDTNTATATFNYVDESGNTYNTADAVNAWTLSNKWHKGGTAGSLPRLANQNTHGENGLDIAGDGIADGYGANDISALRSKLLGVASYANVNGDVSRNGVVNISDLAILQRIMVGTYGDVASDGFFPSVSKGKIHIYYGENDNYDAARKVELYLEKLFPNTDIKKHVSTNTATVSGKTSDSTKVYLHENDTVETPDGKLEIIVGNIDNYDAYKTNTVATGDNQYAVTYDSTNKVVWLQGTNSTAVYQAAVDFVNGCKVDGDTVYTVGATTLTADKQPITVKIDTNFDGTPDTDKTYFYVWGDEFDGDTLNTYNWQHNDQQTENSTGTQNAYHNLEIAPVKALGKVITIDGGKLSLKRAHDKSLNANNISYNNVVGSVAIDVTPGEDNGYATYNDTTKTYTNAIDTDGSDQYFSSGKITTERGMLFKQGYIEIEASLPADGHAFPAWWLMGLPAAQKTNTAYDNSLYGKIYKLNNDENTDYKWDGTTNAQNPTKLSTYKYQVPTAAYEVDMIEVMQGAGRHRLTTDRSKNQTTLATSVKDNRKAVYLYAIETTVHKWWSNGVLADKENGDKLYVLDWTNGVSLGTGIDHTSFSPYNGTADSWVHSYTGTFNDMGKFTSVSAPTSGGSWGIPTYYNTEDYNANAQTEFTKARKYGFSWNIGENGYELTLYIYKDNGEVFTVPMASGMSDFSSFKNNDQNDEYGSNQPLGQLLGDKVNGDFSDANLLNQYMYILFDNKYYSSNEKVGKDDNMYTDLLTSSGHKSFEIDYVRVYQEDGKRDIVTPETEAFNNNNHFGY